MSHRTLARCIRALAIAIPAVAVVGGTAVLAGPFWSGALFLLRQPASAPVSGDDVQHVHPLHKGHVDISTGLYIREDDDFVVDAAEPLVLRRTYLSGDHVSRQFGIGTKDSGDWYLRGNAADLTWAELILSDGRVRFARVTPGTSIATALFRHVATPSEFFGAYLGWVGWEWVLRFADGRIAIFKTCGPAAHDLCSLIEMRYPGGRSVAYMRNESGRLTAVRSSDDEILLNYDREGRIIAGHDSSGRTMTYEYDDRGRLLRVTSSDGVVRRYTYSDQDEMTSIDEPGWIIENTFEGGRLIKQITTMPDEDPYTLAFAYTIRDGKVTANDVTENNGTHTVYQFSEFQYVRSEVIDAQGKHPISIAYDRSDFTNVALAMTIRCWTPHGHVIRTVPTRPGFDDEVKRAVIASECRD